MMQRRIADIELLRGVSIALVVFHHFKNVLIKEHSGSLNTIFSYFDFWIGVDVFFAISGFVVARSLLPQLRSCTTVRQFFVDATAFWLKRVYRLWPSAWLWLGLILLAVIFANRSGGFGTLKANIEATVVALLQVANFRFADVLIHHFEYGASFVYWSLSQEEQFYMLLPMLIFALKRRLAAALVALLVVKGAIAFFLPDLKSLALMMLIRADALLLGVLLAIWSEQSGYRLFEPTVFDNRLARWSLLSLWLVSICGLANADLHVVPDPFRFSVIGLVAVIPVFIASYDKNYLCRAGWWQSSWMWLGSRSYGIYLIHVPAFLLAKEIWFRLMPLGTLLDGTFNVRLTITSIVLIVILSELNYRLIEMPLRRRGVLIADRFRSKQQQLPMNNEAA